MILQNDLLLRAARGEETERPPVWLMRQAGRILPQYRALRARLSGFKELVETPALAAEVTIQPVDELSVDAAIIFSDILVIPEALGLTYEMIEKKGPSFPKTIQSIGDINKLHSPQAAVSELGYVYDALALTKKELAGRVPLIGFAGAPWTLLAYMVEGGGSKTFSKARRFLYQEPEAAHRLLELLTETTILYLQEKIKHGADLVQVFDSWAGILTPDLYRKFALPYLARIASAIDTVPVTLFAKDAWYILPDLAQTDCNVIGLDWTQTPQDVRTKIGPDKCLQGNLDPCLLYAEPEFIQQTTHKMLRSFGGRHIANLGHGVYPDTPLSGVKTFVNSVRDFRYLGD